MRVLVIDKYKINYISIPEKGKATYILSSFDPSLFRPPTGFVLLSIYGLTCSTLSVYYAQGSCLRGR